MSDTLTKTPVIGLTVAGSNWEYYKSLVAEKNQALDKKSKDKSKKTHCNQNTQQLGEAKEPNVIQLVTTQPFVENEDKKDGLTNTEITKVIAMDCEMVGIGEDGADSMLARVSIVNRYGHCIYDKFVKPTEPVKDFRTAVSGIKPEHLRNGEDFKIVQKQVSNMLKGRTLVGHALHNDLAVLYLTHPRKLQRDTSRYRLFRKVTKGNTPSLKKLASELLGIDIQTGEHNSVEDAKATMQLYQLFRKKWESDLKKR